MEALIVIFIVISLIGSINKKARQMNQSSSGSAGSATNAPRKPHKQAARAPRASAGMPTTHAARVIDKEVLKPRAYQTIQPLVRETGKLDDYSGSLGAASMEGEELAGAGSLGYTSTEGLDVCDPTLGHGRPERIERMADAPEAYAICPTVLPERFDGQELVRAVVMTEILNRPQQRLGRR